MHILIINNLYAADVEAHVQERCIQGQMYFSTVDCVSHQFCKVVSACCVIHGLNPCSVAGEAESRPRDSQEVPGGHCGVCTDQGGKPVGPGSGGSPSQVI